MVATNDMLALPIKLPRFEPDSWDTFWKVWEIDAKQYRRVKPDSAGNNAKDPGWHGMCWEFDRPGTSRMTMFDVTKRDYSAIFPRWRAAMYSLLPFDIHRILFQSNYQEIGLHRDGMTLTDHLDYACAVRMMLVDSNIQPNFYFCYPGDETKTRHYLELPEGANTFAYHNPKILHGAEWHGRMKIIAHLVIDNIDEDRWFRMLHESHDAWPDRCLVSRS
jgi:hypothetical protein